MSCALAAASAGHIPASTPHTHPRTPPFYQNRVASSGSVSIGWDMEPVRTILVPVDFSEASMAAFETALEQAAAGTLLVVQHVIDASHVEFATELGYAMHGEVETKARVHAESRMRRLTDIAAPEDVEIERVVCLGSPATEILKLARDLVADLIVIGSRPAAVSFEHALFGSTAERVLRAARCPVLVIPGPDGDRTVQAGTADESSGAPATT